MFIATLIAAGRLAGGDISAARDALAEAGCAPGAPRKLEEGVAADLPFAGDPAAARTALERRFAGVDAVVQPETGRAKRLLVADMDSTMITVECLDELAAYAGLKAEIAAVTERAMLGEIDFAEALDARVTLLKGLGTDAIARCHAERIAIMPGAVALVRTMRARGGRAVLVSGGFTVFADKVGEAIGFDRVVANRLHVTDEVMAGTVARPIVDAEAKRNILVSERDALGLAATETLAVGDGANDIAMIREAGLGIAYRAKPKTAEAADGRIDAGDLTALLYAQGIPRAEWVET